ncbi:TPA: hypothetical protein I7730_14115 [Vibrio vulnificus]|uniref:Uncharacterized protein n=1 Tax=Vibrio vulnificus TaxID=672 RepID=A0A8H9N156_VIBVL|nr:hypothetical protein [Vibrio vulnificus]HAS8540921.1 hypothetical protein [Vibrio vulnificus]
MSENSENHSKDTLPPIDLNKGHETMIAIASQKSSMEILASFISISEELAKIGHVVNSELEQLSESGSSKKGDALRYIEDVNDLRRKISIGTATLKKSLVCKK